jgi:2-polyprenyl-6-methoxyphenol hydroxylase-like FAD-dependent oxidoreductase
MKVIVVGCGRVGSALAYQLHREGHQVTVIDHDSAAFDQLSLDFRGRTIKGDVLDRNVLRRAQVEEADALAAVTRSDSLNALVPTSPNRDRGSVRRPECRLARGPAGSPGRGHRRVTTGSAANDGIALRRAAVDSKAARVRFTA